MKSRLVHPAARRCVLLTAVLLLCASESFGSAEKTTLVVVVSPALPVQQLSLAQLRDIYLGTRQIWDDGTRIVLFTLKSDMPERIAFDRVVLGMSPSEVARLWVDRRIRGQAGELKVISSVLLLQRVIAQTPGAIGYVRQEQLTHFVKAVRLDGKQPGDTGYPLVASLEH
jgi:hypothetical protein